MKPKKGGNARLNKYIVRIFKWWAELTFIVDGGLGVEVYPNNGI